MKKSIRLAFICIISLYFTSCSRVYTAGVVSNDVYHTEKPFYDTYEDSVQKTATYGSASFSNNTGFNGDEENIGFMIQGYKSHSDHWWSASYGGYFYSGDYKVNLSPSNQIPYNLQAESQSYIGFGAKADFFLSINNDFLNFRIIGLEASISKEWGDYQDAMESADGFNNNGEFIFFYDPDILFGWGPASEIEFIINDNIKFGGGLAVGGYIDVPIAYFQGRLFATYKDLSLSFQQTNAISGLLSDEYNSGFSLGVIYRIDYRPKQMKNNIRPTPRF